MVIRMEKVYYEFKVENYSLRRRGIGVNRSIVSDRFVVGGKPWVIHFYPDGADIGAYRQGFTSVFFQNQHTETVEFVSELCLVNQSGKGLHLGVSSFEIEMGRSSFRIIESIGSGAKFGFPYFVGRSVVESPENGYVKDDCLKISVTIGVFTNQNEEPPFIKIPTNCSVGWLEKEVSDDACVIFQVAGGKRHYAHRSVLAARCPAMLSRLSDADGGVFLPHMDPEIFKAVLWFIYHRKLDDKDLKAFNDSTPFDQPSFSSKLLSAANEFELKSLKEICESYILKNVSKESVGYLLSLAEACHAAQLKSACLKFAAQNKAAIMESDGSEYLKETCPLLYMELSCLELSTCDEHSISKGVLDYYAKVIFAVKKSWISRPWTMNEPYRKMKIA